METNVEMEVTTTPSYGQARMRTLLARSFAVLLSLAVINLTVPAGAMTHLAPDLNAPKPAPTPKRKVAKTRLLCAKEMKRMQGRSSENPYTAGQNKWDIVYKGVNCFTGNYSTSAVDLSFEGGYGIPVNVARSYSSNNKDEGPFGKGWTLSADIRNTAGGLLKSGSAPVRSVPTTMKERPALQNDPHVPDANEPVEAVIATDAGGFEETIQKDADGILTTPPWDKNQNVSTYENVVISGSLYQILLSNTVTTPDGSVYVYEKKGEYTGGITPYDDAVATATPGNVLKVVSATDRHGNVTNYTYGSGTVTFAKANGSVSEHPLTSVDMPNGHTITFTWGNGTNAPTNRIRTASDGVRTVTYGYTSGNLTSVTSPAGKVVSYGYGSTQTPMKWPVYGTGSGPGSASNLLTSITDPRGLTTTIGYTVTEVYILPYGTAKEAVYCYKVAQPNGINTYFNLVGSQYTAQEVLDLPSSQLPPGGPYAYPSNTVVWETDGSQFLREFFPAFVFDPSNTYLVISSNYLPGWPLGTPPPLEGFVGGYQGYLAKLSTYDPLSQNLVRERVISDAPTGTLDSARGLPNDGIMKMVDTDKSYNFQGNPLSITTYERKRISGSWTTYRTATIGYAYWGKDKYFQQKATKDQAGRYSYTDYFDSSATTGKKGQTYRVYDGKRTTFALNTGITPPSGTPSGSYWKYQLEPSSASTYSAEFDYDSKGRAVDVWKIQKTTTSPWTYVRSHYSYGADSSPTWGATTSVVEDYGSGKLNRTTQTLAYDSIGRATNVLDAVGREFETTYDMDGVIQSVYRVDGSHNDPVVTYSYGSSGLANGMVVQVTDGLSGVVQDFTYQSSSGGGKGQVASVTETNGTSSYTVSYTYNSGGDRETASYATPDGTSQWKYSDYAYYGTPESPTRMFQTLNKLNSGSPTTEEFHYSYDQSGRLVNATFAQTPQSGQTSYTSSYPAATRARAYYAYDPAGRVTSVEHYWDTWGGSNYSSTPILGNACTYELSSLNRGLKAQSDFYVNSSGSWSLARSETFTYDADLDYLTSADYNDSLANENPSWSYDAAGNRSDATVVDNLNRATTLDGVSRTYDILGNTLSIGSSKAMTWDVLGRMLSYTSGSTTMNYAYRADGMRVSKTDGTTTTAFYYDGQMPIETVEVASSSTVVTRNCLGVRGIDRIERVGTATTVGYPIYDAHGNNVATLTKSGSSFSIGDQRSYDAWGAIRQGATTGDPSGRHCANIGHVQDDESNLIYMRARYYDSSSGRFLSEDQRQAGINWIIYSNNDPINYADQDGRLFVWQNMIPCLVGVLLFIFGAVLMGSSIDLNRRATALLEAAKGFGEYGDEYGQLAKMAEEAKSMKSLAARRQLTGSKCMKAGAVTALIGYSFIVQAYCMDADMASEGLEGPVDILFGD